MNSKGYEELDNKSEEESDTNPQYEYEYDEKNILIEEEQDDLNILKETEDPASTQNEEKIIIVLYRRRWFILFLFSCLTFMNAAGFVTFSPQATAMAKLFETDINTINWLGMMYMIVYIPFVHPSTWLLNHKGLRVGFFIGALATALGGWIRYVGGLYFNMYAVFVGQFFFAVGQAFILGVPSYLSSIWFGAEERAKATSIAVLANQAGVAVGYVVAPLLMRSDKEGLTKDLPWFLLYESILCTIVFVLIAVFFTDSPPSPPSQTAPQSIVDISDENNSSYTTDLKILSSDVSFIFLLNSYGIAVGEFYAISTLLDQLISPEFKGSPGIENAIGQLGFIFIVAGLFGTIIFGWLLDYTRRYHGITIFVYVFSVPAMLFFVTSVFWMPLYMVYISISVLGFLLTSLIPIGYELGAEITYPIVESSSSGILNSLAQVYGIALTYGAGWIIDNYGVEKAGWVLFGFVGAGAVLSFFVKGEALRHLAESSEKHHHEPENVEIVEDS